MKKILIIGLGSIGKKYMEILGKKKVKIGIYDQKKIILKNKNIMIFSNFDEIKNWLSEQ